MVLKSAEASGVWSVLISNFTWVEIYKELLSENVWEAYLDCYQEADAVLLYPFYGEIKDYFRETSEVGLVSRRFDEFRVRRIRMKYEKPLVYLSVGKSVSLERDIIVDGLPYQFIYTQGLRLKGKNTEMLPVDTPNTHDYIRAADYVVTKAGWGTVAETVCACKPMIILKRDGIAEDRVTTQKLCELGVALPIQYSALNAENLGLYLGNLDALKEKYINLPPIYTNCADKTAEKILAYLP